MNGSQLMVLAIGTFETGKINGKIDRYCLSADGNPSEWGITLSIYIPFCLMA